MAPPPRSNALDDLRLADAHKQFLLLLYAPGNGGKKDDNASTAAELASHGYVITAIDDIERDPSPPVTADEILQPLAFEFSSAEAFITTLRTGDRKVRLQAKKALVALDRLTACANANWRARVRFDGVGFFGFSFGGATAAESSTVDPRVAAAANLDGWLFGRAAAGALEKPYMVIFTEDNIFPELRKLQSSDPRERYCATMMERDLREEVRLANRPGGFGFRIRNSYHENHSDQIFSRRFFKTWLLVNSYRIKSIRDAYLLAFLTLIFAACPPNCLPSQPRLFTKSKS